MHPSHFFLFAIIKMQHQKEDGRMSIMKSLIQSLFAATPFCHTLNYTTCKMCMLNLNFYYCMCTCISYVNVYHLFVSIYKQYSHNTFAFHFINVLVRTKMTEYLHLILFLPFRINDVFTDRTCYAFLHRLFVLSV